MRDIKIEKITLNIGCGTSLPVETAQELLQRIANKKVIITRSKRRSTFNVPKDKPIGAKATIRKDSDKFLKRLLEARDNTLEEKNFDATGNFSFGVKEYIGVPGIDYDPKVGILGFDVCVTLERPGYRVKRKRLSRRVGKNHKITKKEAVEFAKTKFGVVVE